MAIRKDGVKSRENLLEAAMEVFAGKGYRDATVAEICKLAGSNNAAVNYHFGSKDELYIAVWKKAFAEAMEVYPPDGGLSEDAPVEKRLYALIRSHLHRVLDDGKLGLSGQILLREMAEHTEVLRHVHHDVITPLRKKTQGIIQELLGPLADRQTVIFCEMSVVHQFIAWGFRKWRGKLPPILEGKLTMELVDQMAEHITYFSLAGISEVKKRLNTKPSNAL